MKLSNITIKNYRAIDDIKISLNSNMNVIYGENGTGKSSIIYLIYDLINTIQMNPEVALKIFHKERVRNINKEASVAIEGINNEIIKVSFPPNQQNEISTKNVDDLNIKCVGFIPGMFSQNISQKIENGQISFEVSVAPKFVCTRGIINYAKLKENFFNLEYDENKKRVSEYEKTGKMEYNNPALQKIRTAIKEINPIFGKITIEGEKDKRTLIVEKNSIPLNVEDQLSSGEASVIAMIGEICIEAYAEPNEKDIVVLIDEVDASLHPQWQMRIGKILKTSFPDVQFIMTSHSPFIWAGLNKEEIIWLSHDDQDHIIQKNVEYAKGGSVESIVAEFFDTDSYDNDFSIELHEIENIIQNKDAKKATTALSKLKKKYGNLPVISQLEFKMRLLGL
ncbi:ATP-binding protein [uncultured Desulfovibrio sp.]|uniref:AAA family ATPase n=1 Tax=uncultured Desulfovibrio sp. TaxID=167968 RepID=UPI002602891E|nr:ATP-binding protein [uncultured Desulfovibrio sp.]